MGAVKKHMWQESRLGVLSEVKKGARQVEKWAGGAKWEEGIWLNYVGQRPRPKGNLRKGW